jgi:hypothetical protein
LILTIYGTIEAPFGYEFQTGDGSSIDETIVDSTKFQSQRNDANIQKLQILFHEYIKK